MSLAWRMCYLLCFVESEFPKCHVWLLPWTLISIFHPLHSTPHFNHLLLHFSALFEGKSCWRRAFYLSPLTNFSLPPPLLPHLLLFSDYLSISLSVFLCLLFSFFLSSPSCQCCVAMWWWLLGVLSCVLLVVVVIFFLTTGQRYKVFSEKCLRPPGPLVTDSRQRDDRLKRGKQFVSDPVLYCLVCQSFILSFNIPLSLFWPNNH